MIELFIAGFSVALVAVTLLFLIAAVTANPDMALLIPVMVVSFVAYPLIAVGKRALALVIAASGSEDTHVS